MPAWDETAASCSLAIHKWPPPAPTVLPKRSDRSKAMAGGSCRHVRFSPGRTWTPATSGRRLDGRSLDRRSLLVHGLDVIRQSRYHHRAIAVEYVFRDPAGGPPWMSRKARSKSTPQISRSPASIRCYEQVQPAAVREFPRTVGALDAANKRIGEQILVLMRQIGSVPANVLTGTGNSKGRNEIV